MPGMQWFLGSQLMRKKGLLDRSLYPDGKREEIICQAVECGGERRVEFESTGEG
jgi:hypothetical protein